MDNEILIRFFNHQCTAEEIKRIDEWLESDPDNARYLFEMERVWSLKNVIHYAGNSEKEIAYGRLTAHINPKKRVHRYSLFMRYAAIFVLLVAFSVYLYLTAPWQNSSGFNLIEVPRGELVSITLSDGTKVWLNADTRFSYPDRFGSRNREVILDGEAYFEVSPNKKKPFIINSERINVEVLGTEFNIRAHKDEDAEVSLKTGKIQVTEVNDMHNKVLMSPNQQMRYTRDGKMALSYMDMSSVDSWRNGGIAFISQPLSSIIKTLERKYKVTITLDDTSMADEIFTCRARSGATLPQVLNLLKETKRIHYIYRDNNNVIITKKDMPME